MPAKSVAAGKYRCVFYVGGQGLQSTPGFTILAGGRYEHDSGSKGTYSFDGAKGEINFSGGSLDKQAGRVEIAEKKGIIRLYNERRSRTVIDCDTSK